jgi:hypothetical protein
MPNAKHEGSKKRARAAVFFEARSENKALAAFRMRSSRCVRLAFTFNAQRLPDESA